MQSEYQLRLTHSALEDLGLPSELAVLPADAYADRHECVQAFVERRSQHPEGPEATFLPVTAAPVHNLHCGRHRGLTWYDEARGVVWLLGVGWHEGSSRDDAYEVLKTRDESGDLFPDESDYLALRPNPERFAHELDERSTELLERAATTGEPQDAVIAEALRVVVEIEVVAVGDQSLREVSLHVGMPPLARGVIPSDWTPVVLAAFFREADLQDIEWVAVDADGYLFRWVGR